MAWETWMNEMLAVERVIGQSGNGTEYGLPTSIRAYIEPCAKRITNPNGQELTASATALISAADEISPGDRVTHGTTRYYVLEVQKTQAGVLDHLEVYLGPAGS